MKRETLPIMCCPKCQHDLVLTEQNAANDEVIDGSLECTHCHASFAVRNGVPRMIVNLGERRSIAEGWGFEWAKKSEGKLEKDTLYGRTQEQELHRFLRHFGINSQDLLGKAVLDAGCGCGWLIEALGKCGAQVYGIDIASTIEITQDRCACNNVHVIQADILNPPFKNGSFDYIWSNLSICYLPNPRVAFNNLAQLTKPSGKLFISVPDKANLAFAIRIRDFIRISHRLPIGILFSISWFVAVFLYIFKKLVGRYGTLRADAFYVFTALHPDIMTRHTREEVMKWFTENNLSDIVCMRDGHALSARGTRSYSEFSPQSNT